MHFLLPFCAWIMLVDVYVMICQLVVLCCVFIFVDSSHIDMHVEPKVKAVLVIVLTVFTGITCSVVVHG